MNSLGLIEMRGGNVHNVGRLSVESARKEIKSLPQGKVAEMLAALQRAGSRRRRRNKRRRTMKKMH